VREDEPAADPSSPTDRSSRDDVLAESADVAADQFPPSAMSPASTALTLISIAIGGAAGALTRYELARAIPVSTDGFPWSTLAINLSGAALLGFLLTLLLERRPPTRYLRPLLGTGFTGAYTTWSTFMVDADQLISHHHVALAVLYVLVSLVGGLAAVTLSVAGTRRLPRSRLTPVVAVRP
jgi:CrcB protein